RQVRVSYPRHSVRPTSAGGDEAAAEKSPDTTANASFPKRRGSPLDSQLNHLDVQRVFGTCVPRSTLLRPRTRPPALHAALDAADDEPQRVLGTEQTSISTRFPAF